MLRLSRLQLAGSLFACALLALTTAAFAQQKAKPVRLTLTTIDVPGALVTQINGINSGGTMVGFFGQNLEEPLSGFSYCSGHFTYFNYPGEAVTTPGGINDSNLVVGSATQLPYGSAPAYGFTYDGATFATLQDGSNYVTYGFGINNASDVVGRTGSSGEGVAFEYTGTRYVPIQFPGLCPYKQAEGINNLGEIVGYTSCGIYQYGYAVKSGKHLNVNYPGAEGTGLLGINDLGTIVGYYYVPDGCYCAMVFRNGKYLSFAYPGAKYTFASGINKSGQIVGTYTFDAFTYHGFITSPVTAEDFNFEGCCQEAIIKAR